MIILDGNIPEAYVFRMMTLSEYLSANSISQVRFAALIGVKQATVSRLARGSFVPSLDLAVRIERETAGQVPASSWVEEPQKQAEGEAS